MTSKVVVVGAGAAGVGVATLLVRDGHDVIVLERGEAPGQAWRTRYLRLRLHTSRRWSHVAGSSLGRGERFVAASAFADHVLSAARTARLDVRCGVDVDVVSSTAGGLLVHCADGSSVRADHVVIATGQNAVAVEPTLPGRDSFHGTVMHACEYRSGHAFAGRRVVVAGAGNSGTEIAQDLVEHGAASVVLSVRSIPRFVSRSLGPVSSHALAMLLRRVVGDRGMRSATGALARARGRRLARLGLYPPAAKAQAHVPTLDHGFLDAVRSGRIEVIDALGAFTRDGVVTVDGDARACDVVVLATGYRPAALELLAPELRGADGIDDPGHPGARARAGVWFVGFGPAPLGQLVLAREHAHLVAAAITRAAR